MIFCDSSFLASLFVESDKLHKSASKIAQKFTEPMPYTLLGELELLNALRRGLAEKALDVSAHDATIRRINDDEVAGFLERRILNQIQHYEKARQLSKKFTGQLFCRSLDLLQVASALVLGAETFVTFDKKQAKLATATGLQVVPDHRD
jgi:predicted nucleic acid-binding protein